MVKRLLWITMGLAPLVAIACAQLAGLDEGPSLLDGGVAGEASPGDESPLLDVDAAVNEAGDGGSPDAAVVPGEGGADASPGVDFAPCDAGGAHFVFVTTTTYPGTRGKTFYDSECQKLAGVAGFVDGGGFRAWLSVYADADSPSTWWSSGSPAFVDMNCALIVDAGALFKGALQRGIAVTEDGGSANGEAVWTGTYQGGAPWNDCCGWEAGCSSSVAMTGTQGEAGAADTWWTYRWDQAACSQQAHLYCFQK